MEKTERDILLEILSAARVRHSTNGDSELIAYCDFWGGKATFTFDALGQLRFLEINDGADNEPEILSINNRETP